MNVLFRKVIMGSIWQQISVGIHQLQRLDFIFFFDWSAHKLLVIAPGFRADLNREHSKLVLLRSCVHRSEIGDVMVRFAILT